MIVSALNAKVGNAGRKLVLMKLADNANDDGICWPSFQYLADHCEMGRSTVKAHIKQLADDGFLTIEPRNDGKSSNRYLLTIENGVAQPKKQTVSEPESDVVTRSDSDPVKNEPGQETPLTRSDSDPLTRSDSDPRTCHSFEPVKNLSTTTARDGRFAMSVDWRPSDDIGERLRLAGIDLSTINPDHLTAITGEFISYWLGQPGREHRQSEWDHRLIRQIINQRGGLTHGQSNRTPARSGRAVADDVYAGAEALVAQLCAAEQRTQH